MPRSFSNRIACTTGQVGAQVGVSDDVGHPRGGTGGDWRAASRQGKRRLGNDEAGAQAVYLNLVGPGLDLWTAAGLDITRRHG